MSIVKLPRVVLGHWPTPLYELPHLSATLGGPRIFVKRDDLTGLALGGNKARKLEYILADAKQKEIDTIITSGSSQSNYAVQTAAAARKLGMEIYLVLVKGVHIKMQGNLLLNNILDSKVNILDVADATRQMNELADELRSMGRNPLVIPRGGQVPLGVAGWVGGAEEIAQQLKEQSIDAQYVVLATGGGATQAGLILGSKQLGLTLNVIGINIKKVEKGKAINAVVTLTNETAKLLDLDISVTPEEVTIYNDYVGQGYAMPTKEGIEAIRLVAQTEGFFLDPVYTGKAMAGLMDLTSKGYFTKKDIVLFVHTGGIAANFAYSEELSS